MIQNTNIIRQNVYYDYGTQNQSFIDMHLFLKDTGVKNNSFFLVLLDPDLAGVDPRDPRLNRVMKQKILRECITNFWYFIREVVRVPDSGGAVNSGIPYRLHRGNLALNFCLIYNYNVFIELPRQHGKTISIDIRILWEFLYGTTNSEMMFSNKKHQDAKDNLLRLKDLREALPKYLQMSEQYGRDGKKLKVRDSVETLSNPLNGNKIKTMPGARNKVNAMSLGRGCTQPRQWYDEFAFILYNKIIYQSATPAYKTASMNAKNNGAPYGIIISTTPGDMTTDHGIYAYNVKEDATKFSETWYDMTKDEIDILLDKNENSVFVYIRFTYQQLGSSEQYFKEMVKELNKDWAVIRREVLLEWSTSSENSPFKKDDLDRVKLYVKQPIKTITVCRFFNFNVYEELINRTHIPIIGVDVSGGYNKDSSAITIIDSVTTRVVADFNCNFISIGDLTRVIYELVTKFMPMAVVNIERNGGFGATVVSELLKTRVKRNLYYEIKDRVIEERFNGMKLARTKQKTRVYGLDSSKNIRNLLMEILRERMEYHKDKFISPIIYSELETLEVKKNGKIEHSSNAHDDQIFSYLLALYVWYYGKDIMERWSITKQSIRTDQDLDDGVISIEEKYDNILNDVVDEFDDPNQVGEQLKYINEVKFVTHEQSLLNQMNEDNKALDLLLRTNPLARKAYQQKYASDYEVNMNSFTLSNEIFMNFNNGMIDDNVG